MTNDKLILALAMIATFDDYGDEIGFTKQDIDNFLKKYKVLEGLDSGTLGYTTPNCNERGIILLLKKGYITNEQFGKFMDVEIIDKKIWLVCDGFGDILDKDCDSAIKILDGEMDWQPSDYYDADISGYWNDYTDDTLKEIIKYCVKNKIKIGKKTMTNKNTILKDNNIYFNDIKLIDLIGEENSLDDLKDELNRAIIEAQESADISEYYDRTVRAFEEYIGEFEWKEIKINESKSVQKLYIKIAESLSSIDDYLKEQYDEYDFETEDYGSIQTILNDMGYFENFREPDYDNVYGGSIDDSFLNEITRERLNW